MASIAGRLRRRPVMALMVLFSASPLLAQGHGGSGAAAPMLIVLLILALIAFAVLRGISNSLKKRRERKRKEQEGLRRRPVPVSEVKTPAASEPVQAPHASGSAKSVFISYRRQDSPHIAGRIYDELSKHLGKSAVFKDVDNIPLGVDFREYIREQMRHCAVLVAVIGRKWNETSDSGIRRLNDRKDHLRLEIEAALERPIPVIPVLVDDVEMPTEEELPPSLAPLAYRNGISVRPDPDFHNDAERLLRGIESLLK